MKKILVVLIVMALVFTGCSSNETTSNKTEEPKANNQQDQNNEQDQANEEENSDAQESTDTPEYVGGHKVLQCNLETEGASKAIVVKMDGTYENIEGSIIDFDGDYVFNMDSKYFDTMESLTYTDEETGEDYEFTPPEGYIRIDESYLKGILGEDLLTKIAMGEEVKVTCNLSNYAHYYIFNSEPSTGADIEIIDFEKLEMPDVYLEGLDNETLLDSEGNEFDIDYSKYSLVIVPMQETINADKLMPKVFDVTETGKEAKLYFSVFGTLLEVKLEYIKNGFEDEKPEEIFIAEKIENECVFLNVELPTDASYVKVTGCYQLGQGIEGLSFALDDMRSYYDILTVDAYSFPNEDY